MNTLSATGLELLPNFVSGELAQNLLNEAKHLYNAGHFLPATVSKDRVRDESIRSDFIYWWKDFSPTQKQLLDLTEDLRHYLNRRYFLGLQDFECHYAIYPPGAAYIKHVDRFERDDRRVLSFALYLTPDWQPLDGGEIELYLPAGPMKIAPQMGQAICFLSDQILHQVLPSNTLRFSIAGWFKRSER